MKKVLIAFLLASICGVSPAFAGGIPVIDGANLAQTIQQLLQMYQQYEKLKEQVTTAQNQLTTAQQELASMRGIRNMAGILASQYDNDFDVDTDSILATHGISPASEYGLEGAAKELYESRNKTAAWRQARAQKYRDQAVGRFNELSKLIAKVNDASDPKDVMDLQARIQAEQAMLQNETIKLQMMEAEIEGQEALDREKKRQYILQTTTRTGETYDFTKGE